MHKTIPIRFLSLLACAFFREVFIRIYITFAGFLTIQFDFLQNTVIFSHAYMRFNISVFTHRHILWSLVQMFCHIHDHKFCFHSNNYYAKKSVYGLGSVYSEPSVFNLFMDLNDEQFMLFFLSLCFCHRKM